MSPTFGHGNRGQVYRYYVSAPLQQGRGWQLNDDAIRRVPAEAVEALVLDRLQKLSRDRARTPLTWLAATTLLRRVEIHSSAVHLHINGHALFGAHADLALEAEKLGDRLPAGESVVVGQNDAAMVRLILPVRLKLRGGRTWIVSPDGSSPLAKAKIDRTLVKGLQASQRLVDEMTRTTAADGSRRKIRAPASAYDRMLCNVAFLAPDIQRAILEGRQPPGFNLQQLLYGTIPLAWADQHAAFGF